MKTDERWRLLELWERARDGRLSPEEQRGLEARILDDAQARRLIAQAALMEAELRHAGDAALPGAAPAPRRVITWRWQHGLAAAAAAVAAAGLVAFLAREPAPVAVLARAHHCKWGNSALPTLEGSRLRPGMLELMEGMATLQFHSGAQVVMEAPVSLEVVSGMECRVRRGTVVADVPPSAKGFTIHTPETKVIDYGTRFGVSAGEDGKCLVHVIDGHVEVQRAGEPQSKQLRAGQRVDYGGFVQQALNPTEGDQPEPGRWLPGPISDLGDGWQMITTAFGRGQDSWIQSNVSTQVSGKESFLRVKHTTLDTKLERKAYVAFDLARFKGRQIADAEFVLHLEPSELGFASLVPDAVFGVHGLTDESEDFWAETELRWDHASAHSAAPEHHAVPDPARARLLGTFTVPQGTTRGAFSIKGPDLAAFLNADTNGIATLIICRQTDETARNGLAHAFASKENAANTPPLLRVRVQ